MAMDEGNLFEQQAVSDTRGVLGALIMLGTTATKSSRRRRIRACPVALVRSPEAKRAIRDAVLRYAVRYNLTAPERTLLLEASMRGTADRGVLARVRRVSADTVKSQVRSLLRRTGAPTLAHAALCVFSEALHFHIHRLTPPNP